MLSDDVILSVQRVSKCFEMYEKPVHRLFQTICAGKRKFYKEFWALRDISFDVRRGECVGVIGKNGAGKSTLLQILVGTLSPTQGSVFLNGRVAALLELGSGFNPEFTGKENVYLNAAILGLSKSEIDSKYQEILDFADIGDFINQPVKTYSSGMMVRLAFAVQVMVEPDILIVDEALSVGDAAFQRKCFAKMEQMLKRGMTLFLVSHDTEMVKRFCQRVIFLKEGCVEYNGATEEGVVEYYKFMFPEENILIPIDRSIIADAVGSLAEVKEKELESSQYVLTKMFSADDKNSWGNRAGVFRWVKIYGLKSPNLLSSPQKVHIDICVEWDPSKIRQIVQRKNLDSNVVIGYKLDTCQNITVYGTNTLLEGFHIDPELQTPVVLGIDVDLPELASDDYFLTFAIQLATGTEFPAYEDMEWQDVCIQLRDEKTGFGGRCGIVKFKTEYSLRGKDEESK